MSSSSSHILHIILFLFSFSPVKIYYIDATTNKIVIYVDAVDHQAFIDGLKQQIEDQTLADYDVRTHDIQLDFLLRHGELIIRADQVDGGLSGPSGSVACLGVTASHELVLLTAQHLFSDQRGHSEADGRFFSSLGGGGGGDGPCWVSDRCYGVLDAYDAGTGQRCGVDIAVLPLRRRVTEKVRTQLVHSMKDVFRGPDEELGLLGSIVWKFGSATGFTEGFVAQVNVTSRELEGVFFAVQAISGDVFADKGDSGSLVW